MTRVLVPLAILEGESVSPGLTTLLEPVDVTVLGYHELPEQTPPDQARIQYEERATEALEDLVETFRVGGNEADHRLVFTHDREQTIDRVAAETAADAYTIPGASGQIERVLVTLTGNVAVDRICSFVGELIGPREIGVTLFLATDDETGGRELLETAADTLSAREIDVRTEFASIRRRSRRCSRSVSTTTLSWLANGLRRFARCCSERRPNASPSNPSHRCSSCGTSTKR